MILINYFSYILKFLLVYCYLSRVLSTLVEIFKESVHRIISGVTLSQWNFRSLSIMEYFNLVDCWLPYFVHHFLKHSIVSALIRKGHVCILVLQTWYRLCSIAWTFINWYLDMCIYIFIQNVTCGIFIIIWYFLPSYECMVHN